MYASKVAEFSAPSKNRISKLGITVGGSIDNSLKVLFSVRTPSGRKYLLMLPLKPVITSLPVAVNFTQSVYLVYIAPDAESTPPDLEIDAAIINTSANVSAEEVADGGTKQVNNSAWAIAVGSSVSASVNGKSVQVTNVSWPLDSVPPDQIDPDLSDAVTSYSVFSGVAYLAQVSVTGPGYIVSYR